MPFTLWFMGRPAAGKSTIAKKVETELRNRDIRVENLDGDELRKNLHPDLGFTREDRAINNRRTAYICRLLNRNGIASIVAMITPFRDAQQRARDLVEPEGDFFLVHVKCSTEVCAERDPKGLYERARAGKIENFTGVDHPFQEPINPEVILDTERSTPDECAGEILERIDEYHLGAEPRNEYEFDISRERETEILERLQELGYLD